MKKLSHTTKQWIYLFAMAFTVIGISAAVVYANTVSARNKQSFSDVIKTDVYNEMTTISDALQPDDMDDVENKLMTSINVRLKEASMEISGEQRLRIRDMLGKLADSLNEQGMITCDADGNLTELSKSYLANAASYAVSSVIGESDVPLSGTVLSDLISSKEIDTAIERIEASYTEISGQLVDESGKPIDLSDMKAQLDTLKRALSDKNNDKISASELALRVAALETMVTTLKNSPADISDYSALEEETEKKLSAIRSELKSIKSSVQATDTDTSEIQGEISRLSEDISSLALKLKDFNQSDINDSLTDLSREISNRQTSISAIQEDIDTIEKSNTTMTSSLKNSVSGLAEELSSLQLSVWNIRSGQLSALEAWKNDANKNIESVQNEIRNLSTKDTNIDTALSSLNQSLSDVRTALNASEQDFTGDVRSLEQSLASVQNQLNSSTDDFTLSLKNIQEHFTEINKKSYDTLSEWLSAAFSEWLSNSSLMKLAIDQETSTRAASDAALQLQIRSEDDGVEQTADGIPGSTIFAKLGTLFHKINFLEQSDEWVQNVTLSHTASSGTKIYGILDSSDSAHSGWKMWKLDAVSLGVTLHAESDRTPESEVVINYAGAPAIIMEYRIEDGYLMIYTPSTPATDIAISSIHVQNKIKGGD